MKYLSIFENETAYNNAKAGLKLPHVSLITATNDVKYDPVVKS